MIRLPRGPDRESDALITCPDCSGSGRVGESRTPCRSCWCRGVVPAWKWRQIMEGRNGRPAA